MSQVRFRWIVFAFASLGGGECLANFSIDPFSTAPSSDQFVAVTGGTAGYLAAQNTLADSTVAGGARNITVTRTSSNRGAISADVSESVSGFFSYNAGNQTNGSALLIYDGSTTSTASTPNFSQGGLGNVDVTQAGADTGVLFQADANASTQVTFTFYTDQNDYFQGSYTVPGINGEPVETYFLPFSSFSEEGFASLTQVNAITVTIDGTTNVSTDMGIAFISTSPTPAPVPEPSSLAMASIGLVIAGFAGVRRVRGRADRASR